jgi:hypothetical protein
VCLEGIDGGSDPHLLDQTGKVANHVKGISLSSRAVHKGAHHEKASSSVIAGAVSGFDSEPVQFSTRYQSQVLRLIAGD